MDPEKAWEKCRRHWQVCPTCKHAGGEGAETKDLCPSGRQLTRQWQDAERRAAQREAERFAREHPEQVVM